MHFHDDSPKLILEYKFIQTSCYLVHDAEFQFHKSMSVVTLAFKCSVIGANGQVDPNSHKFLTWSYFVHEDVITKTKTFSQYGNSLAQRVIGFYPHLAGEATKIVYVGMKYVTL